MNKRAFRHMSIRGRGFTLVELMVTVSILAILLAIGVPNFRNFMLKQQVAADADTLSSAFRLARSEALKRGGVVTICPSPDPSADTPACVSAATTNWSTGWLIFIDYPNAAGKTGEFESTRDKMLHVEQSVRSASITSSQSDTAVSFLASGISSNAMATYTINPALAGDAPGFAAIQRCVVVSRQGRSNIGAC